jgi:hypothetical protein
MSGMYSISKTIAPSQETKSKKYEYQFKSDGHGTSNASHAINCKDGQFNGNCN